jgi:aspartyl protease family protein
MKTSIFKLLPFIFLAASTPWIYLLGDFFASSDAEAARESPTTPRIVQTIDPSGHAPAKAIVFAGRDGAFSADVLINGSAIRMLVDTGATVVVLRHEDAKALGIQLKPSDFSRKMQTANGTIMAAEVVLRDVVVGGIIERNIEALVVPEKLLSVSLLGRSFTARVKIEAAGDRMLLYR